MIVTWVADLLWMIFWIPTWFSDAMATTGKGLHSFIVFITFINFLLKLAVIIMVGCTKREMLMKQMNEMK
jgi:uncharacterized membrane protein